MFIKNKLLINSCLNVSDSYIKHKERKESEYFRSIFNLNNLDKVKYKLDDIKEELVDYSYDYYCEYINDYNESISYEMYFSLVLKNVNEYIKTCR